MHYSKDPEAKKQSSSPKSARLRLLQSSLHLFSNSVLDSETSHPPSSNFTQLFPLLPQPVVIPQWQTRPLRPQAISSLNSLSLRFSDSTIPSYAYSSEFILPLIKYLNSGDHKKCHQLVQKHFDEDILYELSTPRITRQIRDRHHYILVLHAVFSMFPDAICLLRPDKDSSSPPSSPLPPPPLMNTTTESTSSISTIQSPSPTPLPSLSPTQPSTSKKKKHSFRSKSPVRVEVDPVTGCLVQVHTVLLLGTQAYTDDLLSQLIGMASSTNLSDLLDPETVSEERRARWREAERQWRRERRLLRMFAEIELRLYISGTGHSIPSQTPSLTQSCYPSIPSSVLPALTALSSLPVSLSFDSLSRIFSSLSLPSLSLTPSSYFTSIFLNFSSHSNSPQSSPTSSQNSSPESSPSSSPTSKPTLSPSSPSPSLSPSPSSPHSFTSFSSLFPFPFSQHPVGEKTEGREREEGGEGEVEDKEFQGVRSTNQYSDIDEGEEGMGMDMEKEKETEWDDNEDERDGNEDEDVGKEEEEEDDDNEEFEEDILSEEEEEKEREGIEIEINLLPSLPPPPPLPLLPLVPPSFALIPLTSSLSPPPPTHSLSPSLLPLNSPSPPTLPSSSSPPTSPSPPTPPPPPPPPLKFSFAKLHWKVLSFRPLSGSSMSPWALDGSVAQHWERIVEQEVERLHERARMKERAQGKREELRHHMQGKETKVNETQGPGPGHGHGATSSRGKREEERDTRGPMKGGRRKHQPLSDSPISNLSPPSLQPHQPFYSLSHPSHLVPPHFSLPDLDFPSPSPSSSSPSPSSSSDFSPTTTPTITSTPSIFPPTSSSYSYSSSSPPHNK